ncbi:MAG: glutamate-1-semialdehyde 2,1-aminomutase [Chthoniobacterales bacterium]|nr:glutamate-1-semialdehyde 2,1-aminomutase [Chthoniobacterales bacterium]
MPASSSPSSPSSPSNLSAQLWSEALRWIPGGVNSPVRAFRAVGGTPFFVKSASGCRLITVDGQELIDYVGTWGPAILGHAPTVVVEAVRTAATQGLSFGTPNPLEVEMAQTICRMVPSIEKVRMVNSGTEATMSCIRLARGATGRDRIVKFEGCYHGHVDSLLVKAGSGALTFGTPDSAGVPAALAALTTTLPFNDLTAAETLFQKQGREIACVILEPVPANAGLYLPEPGFLEGLQALCKEYGALLIFDEVMTGFRLAPGGYQERCGMQPDLTALGKVIGGGLPVGAFGGRADLMDQLAPTGPVYQAGTLSGNPLALAAGLTQLREMERCDGWNQLEKIGSLLEENIQTIIQNKPFTFHRLGSLFCLYFSEGPVRNLSDAKKNRAEEFAHFFQQALARGIYFAPSQFEAGFISLAHTPEVVARTSEVIAEVLK